MPLQLNCFRQVSNTKELSMLKRTKVRAPTLEQSEKKKSRRCGAGRILPAQE